MTKLEKVIDSLERCNSHVPDACRDCAYDDKPAPDCWQSLERDALELLKDAETQLQYRDEVIYEEEKETARLRKLLKEQEPVPCGEKIKAGDVMLDFYECGYCKNAIRKPWRYCPFCGKAVKWDD